MSIAEIGGLVLSRATQRVELTAQNMTNMTTAGYKARRLSFAALAGAGAPFGSDLMLPDQAGFAVDFTAGKLQQTGNSLDLALAGTGFFTVQQGGHVLYTRAGQFSRDQDGRLVTADGAVLQSASGDIVLDGGAVTVLPDGMVVQNGQPVAQLAIADFDNLQTLVPAGSGRFAAPQGGAREAQGTQVRQGMLEASNVATAGEMISMMSALRSAETGQRIIQVYDDLMGRALTTFGQT